MQLSIYVHQYILAGAAFCFSSVPPDSYMIHVYSGDSLGVCLSQILQNLCIIDRQVTIFTHSRKSFNFPHSPVTTLRSVDS